MSAVLYAHNNNEAISQRQIIRKVIEDALLQYNKNDITETELSSFIEENYHLSISENEILDTIMIENSMMILMYIKKKRKR